MVNLTFFIVRSSPNTKRNYLQIKSRIMPVNEKNLL